MRQQSLVLTLLAAIALSACTSTYKHEPLTAKSTKLASAASVLISTPNDGSYGGHVYTGSGASLASAVRAAFARHTNRVDVTASCRSLDCLRTEPTPYDYLVVPEILHWEDRATEWSGKKDKVVVKISVFDGTSGELHSSTVIEGKSKLMSFGGDHPQDLLPEPLNAHVGSLY